MKSRKGEDVGGQERNPVEEKKKEMKRRLENKG